MTTRRAVLGTVAWTLPTVMVSVTAPGHTPITQTVHVTAPAWWKQH